MSRAALLSTYLILFVGCVSDGKVWPAASIEDVPASAWKRLGDKKIYFGHQSVGRDILEGVKAQQEEHPEIGLEIVELEDSVALEKPMLAHGRVGRNREPQSKIEAFKGKMESGLGNEVDIAFFKFCYVDFTKTTDVASLFQFYKAAMDELHAMYPDTTFLHVTVPLVSKESTLRVLAKKVLGKPLRSHEENIVRTRFNEMMRKEYGTKNVLFDLAAIESSRSDGTRLTYGEGEDFMYALVPRYTDDGGHLNDAGKRIVGEQFLLFLSNTAKN